MLLVTRNGITQSIAADGITRIVLDTGDGDDSLLADASCPPIYAFGGAETIRSPAAEATTR
jgi:hypothetical protein